MIRRENVALVTVSEEAVNHCRANPCSGGRLPVSGQLRALGNMVLMDIMGFDEVAFHMQSEAAEEHGVTCLCEDYDGCTTGVSASVSIVRDTDILSKAVPMTALGRPNKRRLSEHAVVAIYVHADKTADDQLGKVHGVYVAGWAPARELVRWQKSTGGPAGSEAGRVTGAPVCVLMPINKLTNKVRWHHVCV